MQTDPSFARRPELLATVSVVVVVVGAGACRRDEPEPPDPSAPSGGAAPLPESSLDGGWRVVVDDESGRPTFVSSPSPAERVVESAGAGRSVADASELARAFVVAHPAIFGIAAAPGALELADVTGDELG